MFFQKIKDFFKKKKPKSENPEAPEKVEDQEAPKAEDQKVKVKKVKKVKVEAEKAEKGAENNPYLNAREEWLERYGGYISRAAQWRMIAFIALATALFSVVGNIVQLSQDKIKRYFVAVDELGRVAAHKIDGPVGQTPSRVIQAEIASAIENWRTVTVDKELQQRMVRNLTSHTAGAARGVLKQWYDNNNPYEIASAGKLINVTIRGLPLPVSKGSYRVEWTETVRNHQGVELMRDDYEAIVTVEILIPEDEKTVLQNPGGVYITNLSAGKIIKQR